MLGDGAAFGQRQLLDRSNWESSETHPSSSQQPEEGVPGPSAGFEQCDWLVSASFPFDQQRLAAGHQSSTLEAPPILFHPLATGAVNQTVRCEISSRGDL